MSNVFADIPVAVRTEHFTMTIRAETSLADPESCKFTVNRTVHPGGPFFFETKERADGSPLAERLFALDGVANVLVADNVITVGKHTNTRWDGLRVEIGAAIRAQLLSGIPAVLQTRHAQGESGRSDTELHSVIQDLLDREVNKSIANHGGEISIIDIKNGVLSIAMSGGCQGCASSQVTLRQGFEVMLRRVAPEIMQIVDTTDHLAGTKPFYKQRV